jgi:hypothetical protein
MADGSKTPSLIAQLAEGWQGLRRLQPLGRVVVHLVTNRTPFTSDRLLKGSHTRGRVAEPGIAHFATFLAQAWHPAHRASSDEVAALCNPSDLHVLHARGSMCHMPVDDNSLQ